MATVNKVAYARQSAGTVSRVKNYIEREDKSYDEELERKLVTGQNCSPEFADREFIATREAYRKESKTWFHHYTQSFSPQENITPEEAHKIAVEFASKAWPDYEVVIATHLDAEHIHSHFLINAVSFKTGKLLHEGPNNIQHLRDLSDELCLAHNLSVLPKEPTKALKGMTAREYRSAEKGQSWKFRLMSTIDECMKYAGSKAEFIALMKSEGCDVKWTDERKSITYTTPSGMKCRDIKLHEEKYLKENMEREFEYRGIEIPEPQGRVNSEDGRTYGRGHGEKLDSAAESGLPLMAAARGDRKTLARDDDVRGREKSADGDRGKHAGTDIPAARGGEFVQHTGWEAERKLFLRRREAGDEYGEVSERYAQYDRFGAEGYYERSAEVAATHGDNGDSISGVADSLVRLGRAVENTADDAPVKDAATTSQHTDRKTLREEREKKTALGHKPDDHEDKPGFHQVMY